VFNQKEETAIFPEMAKPTCLSTVLSQASWPGAATYNRLPAGCYLTALLGIQLTKNNIISHRYNALFDLLYYSRNTKPEKVLACRLVSYKKGK